MLLKWEYKTFCPFDFVHFQAFWIKQKVSLDPWLRIDLSTGPNSEDRFFSCSPEQSRLPDNSVLFTILYDRRSLERKWTELYTSLLRRFLGFKGWRCSNYSLFCFWYCPGSNVNTSVSDECDSLYYLHQPSSVTVRKEAAYSLPWKLSFL